MNISFTKEHFVELLDEVASTKPFSAVIQSFICSFFVVIRCYIGCVMYLYLRDITHMYRKTRGNSLKLTSLPNISVPGISHSTF